VANSHLVDLFVSTTTAAVSTGICLSRLSIFGIQLVLILSVSLSCFRLNCMNELHFCAPVSLDLNGSN
jgi:hypothetical protein